MDGAPETKYVEKGEAEIAYQSVAEKPMDLVYVPPGLTPIDLIWDHPQFARSLRRLASFSRLILLDIRGYGSSERVSPEELPALQAWMDDILAVLDAVQSRRAALLAAADPGLPAMLLAASHPERISGLVLVNCYARYLRDSPYPAGMPAASLERYIELISGPKIWGSGAILASLAPSIADDRRTRDWFARAERLSSSPTAGVALFRLYAETDLTDVLPGIKVPTLVLHTQPASS